ncbi:hypothetical protein P5G50_18510 [Leifsonia sp. F6_8S_P_1B]|uniref:Uncharacterized protein n=1 Tax=Leifsonia williamsii TaxID=3035919 RepID=A0ABT8KG57_9MICO|nr:hypothetical protein [Leifsonia williamsii]MDN4616445.1 hypothetical protein [Leifsonia williamsii]
MTRPFRDSYEEQYVSGIAASKRLTLVHAPWMGDWFVSHSPRNGNSNAEGQWGQWVEFALSILQHPATEVCRSDVAAAVHGLPVNDFYTETTHEFTDDEIQQYFVGEEASDD